VLLTERPLLAQSGHWAANECPITPSGALGDLRSFKNNSVMKA
jgi:hypothetical protein